MGAAATHHTRLSPLETTLTAEVHESRRIRRVACELERREHLRDLRLVDALSRRRLTDLRCVRH
jgi:hypothetical protein